MSSDILNNLNPGIEDLHPYEPGRSIDEVVAEFGHSEVVKLASNENPLGASPKALAILSELESDMHLYPDGNGTKLKKEIANHENVPVDNIIIGNGSNEILELAARAFLNPDTSSIVSKHAFAVYKIVTQSAGASMIEVPACNWSHDLNSFVDHLKKNTRVIFIANPNNPTGTYNSHEEVYSLLKKVPSSVLVVLDCAYFEYVLEEDYVKPIDLLSEFDNLLITKTFSKIHGLASIRVGYGIANPTLIEVFNRIRQPFNVNTLAQAMAAVAINDHEHIHQSIELNSQQYNFLFNQLSKLGLECIPSVGNFITFKGNFIGKEMFNNLMKKGVIVRSVDLYDMKDFIRVTIGTEAENLKFLNALKELFMKITIIGLGLIGGSIAKNLSRFKENQILAFDTNQSSISNAIENKLIEGSIESLNDLKKTEYEDSLVILATPPSITVDILKSLDFLFNSSVTITDTTSAKSSLNKILQKFNFPENIIFSHPVAGSHLSGAVNSIEDLFKGKSTILSYHDSAAPLHVNRVMNLWQELGSKVSVLDAELHDQTFAYSSHLPHVTAYGLLNTLKGLEQDDLALFSGGGLGEFLRLVSSSPEMWADIFSMNGKNIALAIDDLVKNLHILQKKIANDPESLKDLLRELKAFKESNY